LGRSFSTDGSWDELALAENRRVVVRVIHDSEARALSDLEETPGGRVPASPSDPSQELEMARRSAERIRQVMQGESQKTR